MIPRNANIGENSTTLGAEYGDPAAIVAATDADARIAEFLAALRRPWWDDAACRGAGIADFYATKDRAATARAMTLCGGCPSLLPCRAEAIGDPALDHGLRGGMDVSARRNTRRRLKAQGAPVADVEPTPHPYDPAGFPSLPRPPRASTTAARGGEGHHARSGPCPLGRRLAVRTPELPPTTTNRRHTG